MSELSLGTCATLACLFEATAPKVGNVHRGADFEDLTFTDFAASAALIGPIVERAATAGIGRTVLEGVRATQHFVGTNTNLGILMLIAPLATVPRSLSLRNGIGAALAGLTTEDSQLVYEAIVAAKPGGLGKVDSMDVHATAPPSLLDAMRAAADRDLIARQYATNYADLFERVVPWLVESRASGLSLTESIIHTQLRLLSVEPDSLMMRKVGIDVAQYASTLAGVTLEAGPPGDDQYIEALSDFDFWLRSDGNRRNPGTTADLIAAALFVALRDNLLPPGWR